MPTAGVGDVEQIEQPLHRSVLTFLAVQDEVAEIGGAFLEALGERELGRVHQHGVVAQLLQSPEYAVAAAQRHVALGCSPSSEHRHIHGRRLR